MYNVRYRKKYAMCQREGADGPGYASDIAGEGIAALLGAILTAALLLEHGLGLPEGAERIRRSEERRGI